MDPQSRPGSLRGAPAAASGVGERASTVGSPSHSRRMAAGTCPLLTEVLRISRPRDGNIES